MKNFWIRTASAAVYVLLFLGSMFSGVLLGDMRVGMLLFGAFLLFVTVGCSFEFLRMVRLQGARPSQPLAYLFAVVGFLLLGLPSVVGLNIALFGYMIVFYCLFGIAVIAQLWQHSGQPFREAAYTLLPLLYIAVPLALMLTVLQDRGPLVLLMIVAIVWVNDSGAYIGGSLFGRHKMWPRHSPGKTWEGTAFGVALAAAFAVTVGPAVSAMAWHHWLFLALICSVVGTLGDLVESMLKRSVDVKDSGNVMPGHGGFLDRFDSLLVIMPFVYLYLTLTDSDNVLFLIVQLFTTNQSV